MYVCIPTTCDGGGGGTMGGGPREQTGKTNENTMVRLLAGLTDGVAIGGAGGDDSSMLGVRA